MFHYTRPQILLHWAVVVLLLIQYLFNEAMGQSWRAWARDGVVQVSTGHGFTSLLARRS
ncbi:MAG: hypothetical protein Q4G49_15200 [Paracoccus sp. (in: a-proteobacteria)]|nr:hypothetical protein [Paracoccus sp. (in: a-proteobacteria)]